MSDRNRRRLWVMALAMLLAAGCGGRPTGDVSGTVTLDGQPLALGMISFHNADGTVSQGNIEDGSYHIPKVPVGTAKITVFAHAPPMSEMMLKGINAPAAYHKKFVPVPERYQDPDRSKLSYTIVRGKQTHDVALVP